MPLIPAAWRQLFERGVHALERIANTHEAEFLARATQTDVDLHALRRSIETATATMGVLIGLQRDADKQLKAHILECHGWHQRQLDLLGMSNDDTIN